MEVFSASELEPPDRMDVEPVFRIREATERDCALILSFIKELAAYERLEHEVTASEDTVRQSLFGVSRRAEVVIAEADNTPVGYALFFHNYSTFLCRPGLYLEDVFVRPPFRGRGYGKKLLAHLARLALERGCARMEWVVLDWNESAIRFYESIGAAAMHAWKPFRLGEPHLNELANGA